MIESIGEADELRALLDLVGHPRDRFVALQTGIQDKAIRQFSEVIGDWLALMWAIDAFRSAGLAPPGMGDAALTPTARFAAVYRSKGNWFARIVSLLLQNRTSEALGPGRIQGLSQAHQVDLAWPHQQHRPFICLTTRVTGAPATASKPPRGALPDFSNRRKELKFAAADLKLGRRESDTSIGDWHSWRGVAPPRCYFLWGARLAREFERPESPLELDRQAERLRATYFDGAGVLAWAIRGADGSYEQAPTSAPGVDELLDVIESDIERHLDMSLQPRSIWAPRG